jgi:glucose-1-phosphate thymidylyltransferase
MPQLQGLILAGTRSREDDLVRRMCGYSRYGVPLANRALVRYGVDALEGAGVREVLVAVSPETIEEVADLLGDGGRCGARFLFMERRATDSSLEVLRAARRLCGDATLVVHSGDSLVPGGLQAALEEFERAEPDAMLLSARGGLLMPSAALVGFRPGADPAWGHRDLTGSFPAAIFSSGALRELEGEAAGDTTLGGAAASLSEAGHRVVSRTVPEAWCFAGDMDHLLEANRQILDNLPYDDATRELADVRLEGRVALHPEAVLERTTVRGPAVIGPGARLRDTFVGPYSSIAANVVLDGAEVDNSILMAGCRVRNLGRRIESSVIGVGAEVGRDFAMPSAVRLRLSARSDVTLS